MLPEISIVVCTYNRQKFIGSCLQALSVQSLLPSKWEVIVVDNNSTDGTAATVNQFIAQYPGLPFRYVFEGNKGLSFARNRGIAEATSPLITFIDDDAEAIPEFVATIYSFMQQHAAAAGAGGRVLPKYEYGTEPVWISKYLNGFIGKVDLGKPDRIFSGKMKYPIGCNMTYRREWLEKCGGFNNELTFRGDDKYIYFAVSALNEKIYYLNDALVYHNIDAERLQFGNFKKLFLKTGNEEKIRLRSEKGAVALLHKFFEYIAKFGASVLIWLLFALKGKEIQGRYTMFSQWFTLKGFLQEKVFVR